MPLLGLPHPQKRTKVKMSEGKEREKKGGSIFQYFFPFPLWHLEEGYVKGSAGKGGGPE